MKKRLAYNFLYLFVLLVIVITFAMADIQVLFGERTGRPLVAFSLVTLTPGPGASPTATITSSPPIDQIPTATSTPAATRPATDTPLPIDTPSPEPSATPTPTPCQPDLAFVQDVTVPDGTVFAPGEAFQKIWRVRSSGCAAWPSGSRWVFVSGDQLGGASGQSVPQTPPDQVTDIAVSMVAPDQPGTYQGYWQLQTPDGTLVGERCYLRVVVVAPTTQSPAQPQPQPTSGPPPTPLPPAP